MANIAYVRVSSLDQNSARQLEGLTFDKVFEDKCSGKDTNRPAFQTMMNYVREGDTLHVHEISRLARNLVDLRTTIETLTAAGITVVFHKEALTFSGAGATDPMAKLMLSMLGAFAEFERDLIHERQREGIAIAKAEGKYKGRQSRFTDEQVAAIKARAEQGENKTAIAKSYGVTRQTIYAILGK